MAPSSSEYAVSRPWARPPDDIVESLDVSPDTGLNPSEVKTRRKEFGPNRLRAPETRSAWSILASQFKSLIVALLAAAALVSFLFGELIEGVAIAVVLFINAAIGFVTELRAVRSMEALQELGTVDAKVRREGRVQVLPAEELVPGDVVVVEGGDVVTADLRLIEASKLQADESALTGESVPVGKQVQSADEDAPLAERSSMLYKGTAVTRGVGEGVVLATGMDTELGRISSLVEQAEEEETPLERRLEQLGRRLIWATLIVGALVIVSGILAGKEVFLMIETGIALAVAAIPEGLPIVATVALARGLWRMARRNALVNRLSAVETLGATQVIMTDKTGTLTENQMTATRLLLDGDTFEITGEGLDTDGEFRRDGRTMDPAENALLRQALEVGVLCNDASLRQSDDDKKASSVGDPSEVALLVAGAKAGLDRKQLVDETPEVREVAFDPDIKMMATVHESDGQYRVAVKGGPEAVLDVSSTIRRGAEERELTDEERTRWLDRNEELAGEGLRIFALATKTSESKDVDVYEELTFLGLIALLDPPRADVRPSIESCQDAGIDVVMVTGDQPSTAVTVAQAVGLVREDSSPEAVLGQEIKKTEQMSDQERRALLDSRIFARVSPEQKLDLIAIHQDAGAVVAMTGDGVNDAPALKKADIGVAMGQRGTQVAREASDMVLKDDAFSTIVVAVEQGRVIFNNIRNFVIYLLSCNVAEIMVVSAASLINAPLPILPLQILFLNLVTDVFPALALGVSEGDPAIMDKPPRDPEEPVLTREHWVSVGGYGLAISLSVLGSLALGLNWLGLERQAAVTVSFLTLAFAQLWHVFNMRAPGSGFLRNDVTENRFVWGALALCTALLLAAVYLPGLSDVLRTTSPGARGWAVVASMSLLPLVAGQVVKEIRGRQL